MSAIASAPHEITDDGPEATAKRSFRLPLAVLLPLPAVTLLVIAFLGPIVILAAASAGFVVPDTLPHFERFREVLTDSYYLGIIFRTFRLGMTISAITLVVGFPFAVAISRASGRTRALLTAILIAPLLTNLLVRTLGWVVILDDNGLLNRVLGAISPSLESRFLGSMTGITIALVHIFLPFMVLPLVSSLEGLPPPLAEASLTLGAHPIVRFVRITIPLAAPGIVAGSTLVFLLSSGALVTPLIIGQGRVTVLTSLMYGQVQVFEWGRAAALACVLFVVSLTAILVSQRISQRLSGNAGAKPGSSTNAMVAALSHRLRNAPTFPRLTHALLRGYVVLLGMFLLLPLLIVLKTAFDSSPVIHSGFDGFTLGWMREAIEDDRYIPALLFSLRLALMVLFFSLLFGLLAAYAIVRYSFPGKGVLLGFLLSPLMVPHMVLGIGFILYFQWLGSRASATRLLIVHLVVALPYVTRVLVSALQATDPKLEEAARTLGASTLTTFRRVTLPSIKPGLFAAGLFAFLASFDEATITVLVAGTRNQTLPVQIFGVLSQEFTPAIAAISALMIGATIIALVLVERFVGLSRFKAGGEM